MRTVDSTGLVWQNGNHGERIVGEIHRTRSTRRPFKLVMTGLSQGTFASFEEAERLALAWTPDPSDQTLAILLG